MKTFARLSAALIAAVVSLFIFNAPADAHRFKQCVRHHYYHHHHRVCACHVRHHHKSWRYHHMRKYGQHRSRPADDYATSAPSNGQCKPRLEGIATGQGVFGLGSARARAAAIADFQSKATTLYGASFGSFNRARGASWDCSKLAIIRAKCVVTASPCQ